MCIENRARKPPWVTQKSLRKPSLAWPTRNGPGHPARLIGADNESDFDQRPRPNAPVRDEARRPAMPKRPMPRPAAPRIPSPVPGRPSPALRPIRSRRVNTHGVKNQCRHNVCNRQRRPRMPVTGQMHHSDHIATQLACGLCQIFLSLFCHFNIFTHHYISASFSFRPNTPRRGLEKTGLPVFSNSVPSMRDIDACARINIST